jgi:hypothetical protein
MLSAIVLAILAGCQNSNNANQTGSDSTAGSSSTLDSGWTSLFDGNSLKGWHSYGESTVDPNWGADSGTIHLQPDDKKAYHPRSSGAADLVTDDAYGNFDLKLEWKIGKKSNSGIIFYVEEDTAKFKQTWMSGMEMQVCDKDSNEDAHSYKHQAGDLYDLIPSTAMSAKGFGEWNKVEIISNKNKLDLFLNGVNVVSTPLWDDHWKQLIAGSKFKDMPGFGTFNTGRIALQGGEGGEVWYRNIIIKKL